MQTDIKVAIASCGLPSDPPRQRIGAPVTFGLASVIEEDVSLSFPSLDHSDNESERIPLLSTPEFDLTVAENKLNVCVFVHGVERFAL